MEIMWARNLSMHNSQKDLTLRYGWHLKGANISQSVYLLTGYFLH
jgi:hypothetical protein